MSHATPSPRSARDAAHSQDKTDDATAQQWHADSNRPPALSVAGLRRSGDVRRLLPHLFNDMNGAR